MSGELDRGAAKVCPMPVRSLVALEDYHRDRVPAGRPDLPVRDVPQRARRAQARAGSATLARVPPGATAKRLHRAVPACCRWAGSTGRPHGQGGRARSRCRDCTAAAWRARYLAGPPRRGRVMTGDRPA